AHTFRRADREEATLAFVKDDGGVYKISAFGSQQLMPLPLAAAVVAIAAILTLGLIIAVVMTPVWLVSAIRGRLSDRGGLVMRELPLFAYLSFLTMLGLVGYAVLGSGTSAWTLLEYGAYSQTIFAASIAFPVFAALG